MEGTSEGTLLGGRVRYRQFAAGHRSGFEPVLLAAAVAARPGDKILEAGTGAGAALLCLGHRIAGLSGIGLEIDGALARLANENLKINFLDSFSCVQGDAAHPPFGAVFDHVLANPPWHDAAGSISPDPKRALAHHTGSALLPGWIAGLAVCLKPRGGITLILPAASVSAGIAALRAANCGGVKIFPLWPRAGQAARLVIIAARHGSRAADWVLPGRVLHDASGITPAAQEILRDGGALKL